MADRTWERPTVLPPPSAVVEWAREATGGEPPDRDFGARPHHQVGRSIGAGSLIAPERPCEGRAHRGGMRESRGRVAVERAVDHPGHLLGDPGAPRADRHGVVLEDHQDLTMEL